jgi:hypothetical protein
MSKHQQVLLLLLLLAVIFSYYRPYSKTYRSLQSEAEGAVTNGLASGATIGGIADFFPAKPSSPVSSLSLYSPNGQVELELTPQGGLTLSVDDGDETLVWSGRDLYDQVTEESFNSTMEMHVSKCLTQVQLDQQVVADCTLATAASRNYQTTA